MHRAHSRVEFKSIEESTPLKIEQDKAVKDKQLQKETVQTVRSTSGYKWRDYARVLENP